MKSLHTFLRLFIFLSVSLGALCDDDESNVKINNVDDFKDFVNEVNSGTNYLGTTVLLDSDLSLSGETLEPIGNTSSNYFFGIFDGQGHIISDLKMNITSSYCTGLFGYSKGLTIRNVVLDSSCSITSSFSGSNSAYVGGIIGYCYAISGQCNIENSVNMVGATFSGNISNKTLYLGGIAGEIYSSSSVSHVKNCANYGTVTHSGSSTYSYVGGVIGSVDNSESHEHIYNCLNYGAITHRGTTSNELRIGGVLGYSYYAYIENCVSAGKISTQNTPSYSYVGSIVGYVSSYTFTNNCYYTSELSGFDLYGKRTPLSSSYTISYDNTTFELNGTVSVGNYTGTSLIGALNAAADYYFLRDYSKWLLNKEEKSVTFTINSRTSPITMDSQIILLPSLASEGSLMFGRWYNDNKCANTLESFEVTEDKTLYGRFEENTNNYTITFDTRREGSFVAPITAQFGAVVTLPSESIREHCGIAFWENEYGDYLGLSLAMPAHNFTLYVVWKCTHIKRIDDFVDFSKVVNSGTNYSGTTVFLDSDLSFSGETLEPIGKDYSNYFRGTFDGQGHIISDLKMNSSSSQYTGLFGYSKGLTIRNVVLDSSCSITNSHIGPDHVYMGGIVGSCCAENEQCNIENIVNMAGVSFSGDNSDNLILGGIVGWLYFSSYVNNCANYGSVTQSGVSSSSCIGGIVGALYGSSHTHLYNCLNHGTITHSSTTSSKSYLGGIAGLSIFSYIENCVSAGKISLQNTPSSSSIGSIVGWVFSSASIIYCYYISDVGKYDISGYGTPESTEGTPSSSISVNSTLINNLNSYASNKGWNLWLLNTNSKTVTFKININTELSLSSHIIVLPSLSSDWRGFIWFTDSSFTTKISSYSISGDTTLYGFWENYAVTFDPNGGSVSTTSKNVTYDSTYGDLSTPIRNGYTFTGWFTGKTGGINITSSTRVTTPSSHTLYAHWDINNYKISFDTRREGVSVAPITAQFGTVVSLPSELTREHCSVAFWKTEYGDYVGFSLTMPAHNFVLYAVWKCTHITSPGDFVDFSKVVNLGIDDYEGATVLLDSDLSLSGEILEPIGRDNINLFRGIFDGQGHIISDLKVNTSSEYTGLFGFSKGLTIRNVVLDSSCSITNSYSGPSNAYVGGVIGYYYASNEQCNIENSVNMADVTFSGRVSGSHPLLIGGIAGWLSSSSVSYMKNCANYGSVTHSGNSTYPFVGGVVGGILYGSYYTHIYNCLNHGTITHNGTTPNELHLGGIVGYSSYAYIENCVSAGKISTQNTPSNSYIGSIAGWVFSNASINYCYYTSDVGGYPINGTGKITNTTGTPTSATAVDSSLVSNLNNHASDNGWNEWLLNMNNASVAFKVNDYAGFTLNSQIILLPTLAVNNSDDDDGSSLAFSGWYNDPYCHDLFQPNEVTEGTTLYGVYGVVVTVTFDANGGNELADNKMTVTFNRTYGTLPEASRTGYMFVGWFTENNSLVTSETIVTTTTNHTLHAHWEEVTNQVEVVFNAKDLSKEDIEKFVKKYTNAEFTITEFENGSDGTRVIIRFKDAEKAEDFAGAILSSGKDDGVKEVRFTFGGGSLSLLLRPLFLLAMLL